MSIYNQFLHALQSIVLCQVCMRNAMGGEVILGSVDKGFNAYKLAVMSIYNQFMRALQSIV